MTKKKQYDKQVVLATEILSGMIASGKQDEEDYSYLAEHAYELAGLLLDIHESSTTEKRHC